MSQSRGTIASARRELAERKDEANLCMAELKAAQETMALGGSGPRILTVTVDEIFGPISVDRVAVRPDKTPEEEKVIAEGIPCKFTIDETVEKFDLVLMAEHVTATDAEGGAPAAKSTSNGSSPAESPETATNETDDTEVNPSGDSEATGDEVVVSPEDAAEAVMAEAAAATDGTTTTVTKAAQDVVEQAADIITPAAEVEEPETPEPDSTPANEDTETSNPVSASATESEPVAESSREATEGVDTFGEMATMSAAVGDADEFHDTVDDTNASGAPEETAEGSASPETTEESGEGALVSSTENDDAPAAAAAAFEKSDEDVGADAGDVTPQSETQTATAPTANGDVESETSKNGEATDASSTAAAASDAKEYGCSTMTTEVVVSSTDLNFKIPQWRYLDDDAESTPVHGDDAVEVTKGVRFSASLAGQDKAGDEARMVELALKYDEAELRVRSAETMVKKLEPPATGPSSSRKKSAGGAGSSRKSSLKKGKGGTRATKSGTAGKGKVGAVGAVSAAVGKAYGKAKAAGTFAWGARNLVFFLSAVAAIHLHGDYLAV